MPQNEKTPLDLVSLAPEAEQTIARSFAELAERLGLTPAIRPMLRGKWKCAYSRRKPARVLFTQEYGPEGWRLKANLWHMDEYIGEVESCSEAIRHALTAAYDCRSCNVKCQGGAKFTLSGVSYGKCTGNCYYFQDLTGAEWQSVGRLIEYEMRASGRG